MILINLLLTFIVICKVFQGTILERDDVLILVFFRLVPNLLLKSLIQFGQ